MKSRADRQFNIERLPWVRRLKKPVKCDGIKWGQVSLKHLYLHSPGRSVPALGIPDKARCKNNARWHFKPLKRSFPHEGNYCWSHLIYQGVYGDMMEERRTDRWFKKNGLKEKSPWLR